MKTFCFYAHSIIFITIFLLTPQSSALMLGLKIKSLTLGSELIIRGEVEETEAQWSDDGENIFTSAVIEVNKVIKGICRQKRIRVEYLGGKVGNIGMGVSDGPQLKEGEDVILFLNSGWSKNSRGHGWVYRIFGSAQGKYSIDKFGIARKNGFSILAKEKEEIDIEINLPASDLIKKIRGLK